MSSKTCGYARAPETLHVLQTLLPTEALTAWCQEQKSGRRIGKNFKRRKDFLRDLDMLPDGFPVTSEEPLPDSLITATQVRPSQSLMLADYMAQDPCFFGLKKLEKLNANAGIHDPVIMTF